MGVFTMPSLGADMEAGTLVEWMIKPGDTVKRGDVVAVVETQKGAIEIEIFEAGVVEKLTAELGARLPVGAELAVIGKPGEAAAAEPEPAKAPEPASAAPAPAKTEKMAKAPEPARAAPAAAKPETPAKPPAPVARPAAPAKPAAPATPASGGAMRASPAARAYAASEGIDLTAVTGSGPGGVIVLADVSAGKPAEKPKQAASQIAGMRAAIASAMTRSKHEIPHYYLMHRIDLQPATDWLEATNAKREPGARILMGALFLKAAALAAKTAKAMNGHYVNDAFVPSADVHAGLAVSLRGGGLVAPAIHDADTLSLDDLMSAMRDMVGRARSGRLRSSEMTDGTITISSLGEKGVEAMEGVIYPPQVALVGVGTPLSRPWVVGKKVQPRQVATLSLAADHRASDGRLGARFLTAIETLLQTPEAL